MPSPTLLTQIGRSQPLSCRAAVRLLSTTAICQRNTPVRRPRDPLDTASNAVRHAIPTGETFIVRPPPSAESPYNLGSSQHSIDQSNGTTSSAASSSSSSSSSSSQVLPPPLRPSRALQTGGEKTLSEQDIQKVRALRATDPFQFTASRLAKRFGCSVAYIQIVAPLTKEVRAAKEKEQEVRKANWGPNKTMQRELRKERKSLW